MPTRLPFFAFMAFTFVVLVAPQELFPALAPLHLAFASAIVAVAAHVADRMGRGRALTVMGLEVRLTLTLFALGLLSVPTSYWSGGSVDILVELLGKSLIVFLLIVNVLVTAARLRATVWLLALGCLAPALTVIRYYLEGRFMESEARVQGYVSGLASNANDVALTLNIVIPLALGLALTTRRPGQRLLLAVVIALAVAGVVVTISRAGFLFLAITVTLSLARLRRGRLAVLGLLLLLIPLVAGTAGFIDRMLTITAPQAEASARDRWDGMQKAVEVMLQHPFVGVGIGQGILALNEAGGPRWRQVHNVYLQVGLDLGLPALGVFVVLLYRALRAAHRAKQAWRARGDGLHHLAQGLETSLIGFAVAALFYPIAYHFFFYYLLGLAVAARAVSHHAAIPAPAAVRRPASAAAGRSPALVGS